MVPNNNFDTYSTCPTASSQITYCGGWSTYTNPGSPDYYNACSGTFGVPVNGTGYQSAHSGDGYIGIFLNNESREYVQSTMTPLSPGTAYEVSMYVSLADHADSANNGLGVFFYKGGPTLVYISPATPLPLTPQVSYASAGAVTDKTNWTYLVKYYVADSAYDHIVIGGFLPNAATTFTATTGTTATYYLIDDVKVRPYGGSSVTPPGPSYCTGDTINLPLDIVDFSYYSSGNVFTLQLSDAAGSFASPITLATISGGTFTGVIPPGLPAGLGYRMRVTSSSPADTFLIGTRGIKISSLTVTAGADITICEYDTIKLSATSNSSLTMYAWQGPAAAGFIPYTANPKLFANSLAMSGKYIVTGSIGGCQASDTMKVTIKPAPVRNPLAGTRKLCADDNISIHTSGTSTGTSFLWTGPKGFTDTTALVLIHNADITRSGIYYITYSLNGCLAKDSINVTVNETPLPVIAISNSPICEGDTLKLNSNFLSANVVYSWTGPSGFTSTQQNEIRLNAIISMAGNYIVTAAIGDCKQKDTVHTVINEIPKDLRITGDDEICIGDSLILTASTVTDSVSFKWVGPDNYGGNSESIHIPDFSKGKTGSYTVTAFIDKCEVSKSIAVSMLDPRFTLTSENLCKGEFRILNPSVSRATYRWQDGSTASEYFVNQTGIYWVAVTTKCGIISDTANFTFEECECSPFIPNAFTPNNDGLNDNIHPILNCDVSSYKFLIENRFGQPVFKSSDPTLRWDGNYKGQPAEIGTYFYFLEMTGPRNKHFSFKGDIALIR